MQPALHLSSANLTSTFVFNRKVKTNKIRKKEYNFRILLTKHEQTGTIYISFVVLILGWYGYFIIIL